MPTFVLREDDRLIGNEGEGQEGDLDLRGEEDSMRAAMAEGGATARVFMKNRKTLGGRRWISAMRPVDNRAEVNLPLP